MNIKVLGFITATIKIAAGVFLAGLALLIVVALFSWVRETYDRHEAKQYEVIRDWTADLTANLGLKLQAKTKVVSNKLLLAVDIDGYPAYLSDSQRAARNQNAQIILSFVDQDGFKAFSTPIKVSEFSSIVGKNGEKIGLRTQASQLIDIEEYKRFHRLQVEWTIDTEEPNAAVPEVPEAKRFLDHCAPNISKAERLKRLSQYGTVRETGTGAYSAGGRSVHFFYDGTLLNCQ